MSMQSRLDSLRARQAAEDSWGSCRTAEEYRAFEKAELARAAEFQRQARLLPPDEPEFILFKQHVLAQGIFAPTRHLAPALIRKRRQTTRPVDAMSPRQAMNLLSAAQYAMKSGKRLNAGLTLNLEQLGYSSDEGVRSCFESFIARLGAWADENRVPLAYVYVWERTPTVGLHVHMALHLPRYEGRQLHVPIRRLGKRRSGSDTQSRFRNWLYGLPARLAASREYLPPENAFYLHCHPLDDHVFQRKWMRYLLKGLDPAKGFTIGDGHYRLAELLNVIGGPDTQGSIPFKRAGTSRSLGQSRRGKMPTFMKTWKLEEFARNLWESDSEGAFLVGGGQSEPVPARLKQEHRNLNRHNS